MKREELINAIDETIKENRMIRRVNSSAIINDALRRNNDILGQARNSIKNSIDNPSKAYERGCENAWELARKICVIEGEFGYATGELKEIFGYSNPYSIITKNKTYQEAQAKIDAYEQNKKEEAEKPVVGDEVTYECDGVKRGILLAYNDYNYWVLTTHYHIPQKLPKESFNIKKTGKHFDIQGMLDEIKTED